MNNDDVMMRNTATKILGSPAQQQSFPSIYDNSISKLSLKCLCNICNLNIHLDDHNKIRVGGRLKNSKSFSLSLLDWPTAHCTRQSKLHHNVFVDTTVWSRCVRTYEVDGPRNTFLNSRKQPNGRPTRTHTIFS